MEGLVDYLEKYNIKYLDQIKFHHSLRVQKFLQKNYEKFNIPTAKLEYFTTKIKQKNFRKNKLSNCN